MSKELVFRPAKPDESEVLGEIVMVGLFFYNYDKDFPELMKDFRETNLPTPEYIEKSPVVVLEEDGNIVGWFGLYKEEEYIDLRYMFMYPKFIGKGYGKRMWHHAVEESKKLKFAKMRIVSDPGAMWFYEAMGATKEKEITVIKGFNLGVFWLNLTDDKRS